MNESSPDATKRDKKKKKKNKSKKRKPEDSLTDLQAKVSPSLDDNKRLKLDEEDKDADIIDEEDDKLRREGELIEEIINTGDHLGYNEDDYIVEI